ncbi:E3 ubiquitin-protein ligase MARCHF3-like [Pollicipes pollicipes]|uniref:E3 ubiquitin-protein ligase MARCHF3-like n=1 Tax=Pollicipes pollicipes TaxID=41117 RepID=UPI00188536DF|nr:E3 ubiquitin-protein ligase MARCHF3-like [Pollicipes pollicipes]
MGPFCRICHEGESREALISPCRCAGSVGLVHVSCIEKWLSAANKDSCEICMYKYVTERRPKPILEWLLNPSNPDDARNLIGDVVCFFLLTALAVIAAYLCLMGASHYLSYKTQWEATGLVVLGLLISSIYFVWLVVTCRYHCRVWHDWRHTHQDVHLLEMKRRSQSTVELNNNAAQLPAALCPGCQGGSYSCARCCACPHHVVQLETPVGADDVFEEGGSGPCAPLSGVDTPSASHAK